MKLNALTQTCLIIFSFAYSSITHASTVSYSNTVNFQNALTGGATLIDTSANIGKTTAELSAATQGTSFFGPDSFVRNDGLIPHGAGFYPAPFHIGLNFDSAVNGVAITSNANDGGVLHIYSSPNATGNLIGSVAFGQNAAALFGGIISTDDIRSAIFTCDYNFDLKCGLIDPIFGTISPVPIPAAAWLFASGLLGIAGITRNINRPN